MHKKFFAAIIFLLVTASLSWAETFSVTDIDSFTDAIHSVNSPSVTEENIIEFDSSVKDLTLTQEFIISAKMPVIILGNGVNLTAANNSRLFTVSSSTVSFDRITFTGGNVTTGDGGAVRIEGQDSKVDFTNCTFYDNEAEYYGGAICATDGTTNLYHCTIAGNIANNGGGVAVRNGTINIFASIIIGNTNGDIYRTDSGILTGSENIIGSSNYNFDSTNLVNQNLSDVLVTNSDGSPMLEIIDDVKIIRPSEQSPAIDFVDSGNNYANIDETGTTRPQSNYPDAGSYESILVTIEKISIDCYSYMQIDSVEKVSFEILPQNASLNIVEYPPYGITWAVDDPSIISVDSENYIYALRVGSTNLRARAHGWDSTGKKIITSDPILITVGTEERRERLRASIAQINDVTINKENYRIITPVVSVDMNNVIYEDYPYTLTARSYAENIVTVETISDDTSIILYAGDEIGSADISVTARPYPDGDATTIYFVVRVAESQSAYSSGGSGGCNSGFLTGVIILCAYFINRERRSK